MLTGPNEGYIMADRGIFGVSLWESLPPDLKRRMAIDLAVGAGKNRTYGEISGRSCHKPRARAERATNGSPRRRAFAQKR